MKNGWFDAFRDDGAPSSFDFGSVPFCMDQKLIGLLLIFLIPSLAYILILPGIRRFRLISTFTFLFSMLTGAILLVSIYYPGWQMAETHIFTNYKSFNDQRLNAKLGIKIGLKMVNITLTTETTTIMNYNEQFELRNTNPTEFERALTKGLPYPFLTVAEYLCIDVNDFNWGKKLHFAGYYTTTLLWSSFALWLIQMIFLCIVPRNFAIMGIFIGIVTILSNLCYISSVPNHLFIRFPNPSGTSTTLQFQFSWCFFATLFIGITNILFGSTLLIARHFSKYIFETVFSTHFDHTYHDQQQNFCFKKHRSVAQSLKNLDIYVLNSRQNASDDHQSLATPTRTKSFPAFDRFCQPVSFVPPISSKLFFTL